INIWYSTTWSLYQFRNYHFYQHNPRTGSTTHLGLDCSTITNDGTVCVYQAIFMQASIVEGNGCWDVGLGSNFFATNVDTRYMSECQVIYLGTPSSSLRIDVYRQNQPIHVAGWGNNNVIGSNAPITAFYYDGTNLFYYTVGTGF
ncbi:Hyphally-regulated cell wall protein, partial [Scheffersomyces xylosifermentans]|uniref:Hyphally-regulated cell wall protein n=1 Tax=Scheffersomyces xylosifermentans TaxID=1304137 RepID=UPI00315D852A